MSDISKISTNELLSDLRDGIQDEKVCDLAMSMGITYDKEGFSTLFRLTENKRINGIIRAKLDKRGISHE